MPNITMLDIEALRQTKLRPYIEKCLENRAPDPGFHAMMYAWRERLLDIHGGIARRALGFPVCV